jgi:hypothetical protein
MAGNVCGDCKFHLKRGVCPKAEYKKHDLNAAACAPTDTACELFQPKKGKKKEKQQKLIYRDSGFADQGYFEAIYHKEKPCFLVTNDNHFSLHETVNLDDKTFTPKDAQRIPYEPYGYFEGQIPNREELFWRVRREFQTFIDLESIWIDVLSASVLLSYQQEKLQTVPYIFVYGDNESGKSTVLQLLKFLCYRPMYGVTVPSADIYGYLEDVNSIGCVLEDEVQGVCKDIDKVKIYKAGYKKGACVPRTLITQHDRMIKYYNTFAFKAVASEKIPTVKGFRERFIEISMIEGYPEKEWADITKNDITRLAELRNTLLKWRMLSRDWELPNPEVSMRGRLKEIWKPLLQVTHGLTIYDTLANFVDNQKNERLSIKQNSLEGHIVKVVVDLFNASKENKGYLSFQSIWNTLADDLEGKIDPNKPHVMDTSEFFRVSKQKVGYRLGEVLSGKSKTVREGEEHFKAYEFDFEKLRRIAKKYGHEFVTKSPLSPTSKGVQASFSSSKTINNNKNNVEKIKEKEKKQAHTPPQLGDIGDTVTKNEESPTGSHGQGDQKTKGLGDLTKCDLCGKTLQSNYFKVDSKSVCFNCYFDAKKQTCPVCGGDMPLSQLSNVNGKPACKTCAKRLEAQS